MLFLKKIIQRFRSNEYLKSISTLMTGTGIAQIIPIITAPILTRIYSSYDFGVYAIFYSIYSVLVTISTFRYEMSIFLPPDKKNAINIMGICFFICSGLSILILVVLLFLPDFIGRLFNLEVLKGWIYLLPLFLFLSGMYNSFNVWFLRNKEYKFLSQNKVILAVSVAVIQISVALFRLNWIGLIISSVLGQALALSLMIRKFMKSDRKLLQSISMEVMKVNFKKHKKFPIFTMPSDLINNVCSQLPVFFINSFFGKNILGFYSIGVKMVSLPLSFLGASIQDVFRQQASMDYATHNSAKAVYVKTFKILLVISGSLFIVLELLSPSLFSFILGAKWRISGEFIQILAILIVIRFVGAPLSYMILIAGKHQYDFLWQLLLIAFTATSFYIGRAYNFSIKETLLMYSVSVAFLYLINIYISYKFSSNVKSEISSLH